MSNIYGARNIEIISGSGADVTCADGKNYIDFLCGNGSALFGHCHPVLTESARSALEFPWTVSPGLCNSARDGLRSLLSELLPDGKVFLCNSGAEAIEAAMKLALCLREGRKKIVAARRAFHGRTMGALSLTFNPHYRKTWSDFLIPVQHVKMEEIAEHVDDGTAFVIVEPVQGEGGVFPMDEKIAAELNAKCAKCGALLVSDEIQSGWGRCGSLLAGSLIGLEPDIVVLAKGVAGGLPVGAVVWKGALGDFPPRGHGSTYGGNPVVASVGIAARKLLDSEKYPERAAQNGSFFVSIIKNFPHVLEARHKGLLIGLELDIKSEPVIKELQDNGVLALAAGPQVVRFLPPFVAEERHFVKAAEILKNVLSK